MAVAFGPIGLIAAYTLMLRRARCVQPGAPEPAAPQRQRARAGHRDIGELDARHARRAVGGIALGWLADAAGIPAAMALGALALAAAAPLYLLARPTRTDPMAATAATEAAARSRAVVRARLHRALAVG